MAEELAGVLLGSSPREPQLLEAARNAAEDVLHFRHVQRYRHLSWVAGALQRLIDRCLHEAEYTQLAAAVMKGAPSDWERARQELEARRHVVNPCKGCIEEEGVAALLKSLSSDDASAERLWDYERRAHSRRRKSLQRLDYLRVEAERRSRKSAEVSGG